MASRFLVAKAARNPAGCAPYKPGSDNSILPRSFWPRPRRAAVRMWTARGPITGTLASRRLASRASTQSESMATGSALKVKRAAVPGILRLEAGTTCVPGNQSIHDVQHEFLAQREHGANLRDHRVAVLVDHLEAARVVHHAKGKIVEATVEAARVMVLQAQAR